MATAERVDILLSLKSSVEGAEESLKFLKKFTEGLTVVELSMKAWEIAKSSGEMAVQIKHLAAEANLTTDAFQTLTNGGAEFGVKQEQLVAGAVHLRKNLEEAAKSGASPLNDQLHELGLTAAGLQALAPERQFEAIGAALAEATDKEAAFAAAMDLIGKKNAPKLLEFLKVLGVEGFEKIEANTRKLALSEAELETLDKAATYWERIKTASAVHRAQALLYLFGPASDEQKKANEERQGDRRYGWESMQHQEPGVAAGVDALRRVDAEVAAAAAAEEEEKKVKAARAAQAAVMAAAEKAHQAAVTAAADLKLDWELAAARRKELQHQVEEGNKLYLEDQDKTKKALEAAGKAALTAEFTAAIDHSRDALRNYEIALNAIADNPFLTDVEKRSQRVALLKKENEEIETQIALLKKFSADNPQFNPASVLGHIAGQEDRKVKNTKEINRPEVEATGGIGANVQANFVAMLNKIKTPAKQIADTITGTIGAAFDSIGKNIRGLIDGTESWHSALRNVVNTITGTLIDGIIKMFTEWVLQRLILSQVSQAASVEEGAVDAIAKAPGALMTSISSYGLAAIIGVAAIAAALAAFGGFERGGYTGDMDTSAIAGVVHGQEFVHDAQTVNRLGVPFMESLRFATPESLAGASPGTAPLASAPAASGAPGPGGKPDRTILVDHRDTLTLDQLRSDPRYNNHIRHIGRQDRGV